VIAQQRGHFPGQEQPDVGGPNGDRPRSFDARFLDTDDAVGEWARIWPLQTLAWTMGAYSIRHLFPESTVDG